MSIRTYTVLLDSRAGLSIQALAQTLELHGVVVTQQLETLGVIVGRIDDTRVSEIRAIPGVGAVEEERQIDPS